MPRFRLDLPRYNCTEFAVFGEIEHSEGHPEQVPTFLRETRAQTLREGDEEYLVAVYLSNFQVRDSRFQVSASVRQPANAAEKTFVLVRTKVHDDNAVQLPIRGVRSTSRLLDIAPELFGPVVGKCRATFQYRFDDGFVSRVPLPHPIMLQNETLGFTHIEDVVYGRRVDGELEHTMGVWSYPRYVEHSLNIDCEFTVDLASLRSVLRDASSISLQLIDKQGEISHDD